MNKEEIYKELEKIDLSTSRIRELLELEHMDKLVKTQQEFDKAIMQMAIDRAKSDNPKTINGVKNRILSGKIIPKAGKEAEALRDKYGISVHAWSDLEWYRKTLQVKIS